jgi:type IV pilus assembly protein PilW
LAVGSASATVVNPYSVVTSTGATQIDYAYSRDATENNALDANTEQFGFKLDTATRAIQMNIGGPWQTITNPEILTIPDNGLTITPTETTIDIRAACAKTCTDSATQNCPKIQVRTYNIVLTGVSKTDAAVSRTLRSQVRVRNDALAGSCPA